MTIPYFILDRAVWHFATITKEVLVRILRFVLASKVENCILMHKHKLLELIVSNINDKGLRLVLKIIENVCTRLQVFVWSVLILISETNFEKFEKLAIIAECRLKLLDNLNLSD